MAKLNFKSLIRFDRIDLVLFGIGTAFYLPLLYPSFQGGDTGEFLASTCEWGNVHPPGYPYQVIVFKLWNWMTSLFSPQMIGELGVRGAAIKAHLLSAILTVFSAVILRKSLLKLTGNIFVSVLFACLFLVLPPVTEYALQVEVFPLFYFLLSLFYLLIISQKGEKLKIWFLGFVTSGLLLQHQTSVFFLIPAFWIFRFEIVKSFRNRSFLHYAIGMIIGALPILALPFIFNVSRHVYWGDLSDLSGLLHYLLRKDYGTLSLMPEDSMQGAPYYDWLSKYGLSLVKMTFGLILFLGFDLAVKVQSVLKWKSENSSKRNRKEVKKEQKLARRSISQHENSTDVLTSSLIFKQLSSFTGFGLLTFAVVFHSFVTLPSNVPLQSAILSRMWNFSLYPLILFLGCRFAYWIQKAHQIRISHILSKGVYAWVVIVICIQATIRYWTHHSPTLEAKRAFEDSAMAAITEVPQNSIFLVDDDHSYHAMLALQACGQIRDDVTVLSPSKMVAPWQKIYIDRLNAGSVQINPKKRVEYPGIRFTRKSTDGFTMQQFLKANLDGGNEIVFYPNLRDDGTVNVSELGANFVPLGQISEVMKMKSADEDSKKVVAWLSGFDKKVSQMTAYLIRVDSEVSRRDQIPFIKETTDIEWLRYQRDQSLVSVLRMYLYLSDLIRMYPANKSSMDLQKAKREFGSLLQFASERSISISNAFSQAYQAL